MLWLLSQIFDVEKQIQRRVKERQDYVAAIQAQIEFVSGLEDNEDQMARLAYELYRAQMLLYSAQVMMDVYYQEKEDERKTREN